MFTNTREKLIQNNVIFLTNMKLNIHYKIIEEFWYESTQRLNKLTQICFELTSWRQKVSHGFTFFNLKKM